MFTEIIYFLYSSVYYFIVFSHNVFYVMHSVLPIGLDVCLAGYCAYFITRLRKPDDSNVISIFGPMPGSKDSDLHPEKVVQCIAHRGAALDAPENTMAAFKYCLQRDCNFVELDVRVCRDGKLVLLHDQGLQRISSADVSDIQAVEWDKIKDIDVGVTHPNQREFKDVRLCLLDEALDFLLANKMKIIIDVKGDDAEVIDGVLKTFSARPMLYQYAAVTCFNPWTLRQIRRQDPQIVGAISYRPYCFSHRDYDAETGPSNPRHADSAALTLALRAADALHALAWRWTARWCSASAVLVHKDIVSPSEVQFWRSLGIRCIGWCVNRPVEKLYWRGVLKTPYLAHTLIGESDVDRRRQDKERDSDSDGSHRAGPAVDRLLEPERKMSSGQN